MFDLPRAPGGVGPKHFPLDRFLRSDSLNQRSLTYDDVVLVHLVVPGVLILLRFKVLCPGNLHEETALLIIEAALRLHREKKRKRRACTE